MDIHNIKRQAEIEFKHEQYRQAIEDYKAVLRKKRSLWDRLFRYKILIIKKES